MEDLIENTAPLPAGTEGALSVVRPLLSRPSRPQGFTITHVTNGFVVEKWQNGKWFDASTPPKTSNPKELLALLHQRIIEPDDTFRVRQVVADTGSKVFFQAVWADGSAVHHPQQYEGFRVPVPILHDWCGTPWRGPRVALPDLRPVNLEKDLSNADLSNADLSNADLSNTNLTNAQLYETNLSGCRSF